MGVKINTDEHVFIGGMTGCGKSFLAECYLAGYDYVVKLDTKHEADERRMKGQPIWRGLTENKDFTVIERLSEIDDVETKKIIYQPHFEEMTEDFYNAFLKWSFERTNTIVWIDELMSISSAFKYPLYLKAIATMGRSKNVSLWALTQRPTDIPSIITANATHFFCFDLALMTDRKKMAEITGHPELLQRPGKYQFWYYRIGSERPVLAKLQV